MYFTAQTRALKTRSHDPILRIWILVPKIGSRRSDGLISRFRFCGENVGRSFVVCSHDPIFRTNKESSIWHKNDHSKFCRRLSSFKKGIGWKIEHVLFPSVFSKLRICVSEGHFQCVHTIRFSEPAKVGSLKTNCVNGPSYNKVYFKGVRFICSPHLAMIDARADHDLMTW